jgi:hypothetical protein
MHESTQVKNGSYINVPRVNMGHTKSTQVHILGTWVVYFLLSILSTDAAESRANPGLTWAHSLHDAIYLFSSIRNSWELHLLNHTV